MKIRLSRRVKFTIAFFFAVLLAVCGWRTFAWASYAGPSNSLQLNLTLPDAVIQTQSLSKLPKDLLSVPLLRDVLTEDFVFYYEQHPDRLGLSGSLRRIAYEHELNWGDRLLKFVLDEPAEVALWRNSDGTLKYFLISVSRNKLAKVLQEAATLALKGDAQLKQSIKIVVDGKQVQLLTLDYAYQRTLLFASHGNRVVIFSDPGMLLKDATHTNVAAESVVRQLLSNNKAKQGIYSKAFHMDEKNNQHKVLVRTHFLSFGYQHFFPAFEALRFDFDSNAWTSQVLIDGSKLSTTALAEPALWQALPWNPAACSLLPVDWKKGNELLNRVPDAERQKIKQLLSQLQGSAAICWYRQARLNAPLIALQLNSQESNKSANNAVTRQSLAHLFSWMLNKHNTTHAKLTGAEDKSKYAKADKSQQDHLEQLNYWEQAMKVRGKTYKVAMAQVNNMVVFSPDKDLVQRALNTIHKKFPSVGNRIPLDSVTLAVFVPAQLSSILKDETFFSLPANEEPVFRNAADQHLMPKLKALAKHPAYRLSLSQDINTTSEEWYQIQWQQFTQ